MSNLKLHTNTKSGLLTKLLPWIFLFSLGAATELLHRQIQQYTRQQALALTESYARELATILEYELNASVLITHGIASYIMVSSGRFDAAAIEPWVIPLVNNGNHFRNVAIAPGNTVNYVYPLEGNENVLGLHYPRNPSQWPEIETIILSRKPMLAGPVPLVQGGQGLIYRYPVYIDRHYWGIISTVISADSLFTEMQQRADKMDIRVALIDGRKNRKFWRLVWGESALLQSAAPSMALDIPGRNWQLLVERQSANWVTQHWIRIAGWGLAVLLGLLSLSNFLIRRKRFSELA